MLDALHNLVSFARRNGVSQFNVMIADSGTIVTLWCATDADHAKMVGQLAIDGATWDRPTYTVKSGEKQWSRSVMFLGVEVVVIGPEHTVTQEAA